MSSMDPQAHKGISTIGVGSMNYNQFLVLCDILVLNVYLQSRKREVWFLLNSVNTLRTTVRLNCGWAGEVHSIHVLQKARRN